MTRKRIASVARWIAASVVIAELFYLVAANVFLQSGVIQRLASRPVENVIVNLDWD